MFVVSRSYVAQVNDNFGKQRLQTLISINGRTFPTAEVGSSSPRVIVDRVTAPVVSVIP